MRRHVVSIVLEQPVMFVLFPEPIQSRLRLNIWQARALVPFDKIIFAPIRVARTNIEIIIKSECETVSNMPINLTKMRNLYTNYNAIKLRSELYRQSNSLRFIIFIDIF